MHGPAPEPRNPNLVIVTQDSLDIICALPHSFDPDKVIEEPFPETEEEALDRFGVEHNGQSTEAKIVLSISEPLVSLSATEARRLSQHLRLLADAL